MNAIDTFPPTPLLKSPRSTSESAGHADSEADAPNRTSFRWDLIFFAACLVLANAPFPGSAWRGQLAFFPQAVARGEWWRVLTHPFVHVSWYHLLLDGAAFFMLYTGLRHWSAKRRMVMVGLSAFGSMLAALASTITWTAGFGGLSGVAHGLMAVSALEMIRRGESWERRAGWCALIAVITKAGFEAISGEVALPFLHFGLMGTPVVACHAGGVIGGMISYLIARPSVGNLRGLKTRILVAQ